MHSSKSLSAFFLLPVFPGNKKNARRLRRLRNTIKIMRRCNFRSSRPVAARSSEPGNGMERSGMQCPGEQRARRNGRELRRARSGGVRGGSQRPPKVKNINKKYKKS